MVGSDHVFTFFFNEFHEILRNICFDFFETERKKASSGQKKIFFLNSVIFLNVKKIVYQYNLSKRQFNGKMIYHSRSTEFQYVSEKNRLLQVQVTYVQQIYFQGIPL